MYIKITENQAAALIKVLLERVEKEENKKLIENIMRETIDEVKHDE